MAFEHEAMHLKTMIYMMSHCPPGMLKELTIQRPFDESVKPYTSNDACFQYIPGSRVSLGRSHLREGLKEDECNNWGWDNEYPEVQVSVKSFRMLRSNVTVRDYVDFLVSCQTKSGSVPQELVPVSWMQVTQNKETLFFNCDDYAVRSLFGPVSLHEAFSWPVFVNGLQAEKYATQQGCRLPTEAEWILAKTNQEARKIGCVQQQILEARHTGVHKTMSVKHYNKNVGFKSWCPSNISIPLNQVSGKENVFEATENFIYDMVGSGWEWTCTIFGSLTEQIQPGEKIEEVFIEQDGYPEYSSDFFDGKHWVVLGGSWATHPSLSDRRTFRNWYQPGYGYVFAKFRCVQDINLSELPELA
jgi:formylglycine-generating enzyme required for sulfatase activity